MDINVIKVGQNAVTLEYDAIQLTFCFFNGKLRIISRANMEGKRSTHVPDWAILQMEKRATAILRGQQEKVLQKAELSPEKISPPQNVPSQSTHSLQLNLF